MEIQGAIFITVVCVSVVLGPALLGRWIRKHKPPIPFWGPLFRWIGRKLRP
jgi:hypothetical protein